jgi:CheY-like chemotaxis protein
LRILGSGFIWRGNVRKKVLIVDDAATIVMMEQLILAKTYEVVTARNGLEAVEKAVAERPDLILLDIMMPMQGGIETCRQLRSKPETSEIPIIMVSTRSEIENVEASYESGCSGYVTKPINGNELLSKVKSFIGA